MVFQVIPKFAQLIRAAVKKAGGGTGAGRAASQAANKQVMQEHPEWFKKIGKNKPSSMKPGTAPTTAPKKGSAWGRLSPKIKDQLLKKKGEGMSKIQLEKYREMYRNRNQ